MKLLILTLCCLLLTAPALIAQTLDPVIQDAIAHALPPAYVIYVPLIALVVGAFARYLKGRKNGLSHMDAIMAVLCGTNTPTGMLLVASICMLSLTSCAPLTAFLASPAGAQTVVALADLGLNAAAANGKISTGDNVAIQRGLAVITNPSDPTSIKVFSLAELGLQAAVARGAIKQGDALIIQEGAAIIKNAVITPQPLEPKQPAKVATSI